MTNRPHILKYQITTESRRDENGILTPGTSSFVGEIPCRAVPNGRASAITFEDGRSFVYSHTIYLDLGVREFSAGETVQVSDDKGRIILEKPIHGAPHHKQWHTKLFV